MFKFRRNYTYLNKEEEYIIILVILLKFKNAIRAYFRT